MANFQQHFLAAAGFSGIVSSGMLSLGYFSSAQAILAFGLGTVGGLLPDLDSDNSTPLKVAREVIAITLAFIVMYSKAQGYSIVVMAFLWLAIFFFIKYGLFGLFNKFTHHRGMFHSLPAALIFALLFVNSAYYFWAFSAMMAWVFGFFIFLGYLVHLLLDELVSINLLGQEMKKSFGTALKLLNPHDIKSTLAFYAVLGALFYVAPWSKEFNEMASDKTIYKDIFSIILPQGEWFKGLLR